MFEKQLYVRTREYALIIMRTGDNDDEIGTFNADKDHRLYLVATPESSGFVRPVYLRTTIY